MQVKTVLRQIVNSLRSNDRSANQIETGPEAVVTHSKLRSSEDSWFEKLEIDFEEQSDEQNPVIRKLSFVEAGFTQCLRQQANGYDFVQMYKICAK